MAQNQHPYSGPLRNPFDNIVADDDEFGDFTSAVSFPTPVLSNGTSSFHSVPHQTNGGVFFNPLPLSVSGSTSILTTHVLTSQV